MCFGSDSHCGPDQNGFPSNTVQYQAHQQDNFINTAAENSLEK